MSRTPRRVETKKPTNRNRATSAPSRTSSATCRRAAANLSIRVTSSASNAGVAACASACRSRPPASACSAGSSSGSAVSANDVLKPVRIAAIVPASEFSAAASAIRSSIVSATACRSFTRPVPSAIAGSFVISASMT